MRVWIKRSAALFAALLLFIFGSLWTAVAEESVPENTITEESTDTLFDSMQTLIHILSDPGQILTSLLSRFLSFSTKSLQHAYDLWSGVAVSLFFGNGYIQESLSFFRWLAGILITCGLLSQLLRQAERAHHGEAADLRELLFSALRAYGLLLFCSPGILWLNSLFLRLVDILTQISDVTPQSLFSGLSATPELLGNLLLGAGLAVVTWLMVFRLVRRMVTLYIQICVGYFYTYDLMQGNRVLGEWGREVLAGFITYGFQMVFYEVGLVLLARGMGRVGYVFSVQAILSGGSDLLVGLVLLFGVGTVPMALHRWGRANQSTGGLGRAAGMAVNVGLSAARLFV